MKNAKPVKSAAKSKPVEQEPVKLKPTEGKPDRSILETFPNPYPRRDYLIEHVCEEFTSVCPITGQPDYGRLTFQYIADETCVELRSLKFYLQKYRNQGIFYENVTNTILEDLVAVLSPRAFRVISEFTPRGGIHSRVVVEYTAPGWKKPESAFPAV